MADKMNKENDKQAVLSKRQDLWRQTRLALVEAAIEDFASLN